jgi:hypothetical protein
VQKGTSALPPKADMCSANSDVRYGPKADISAPSGIGFTTFGAPSCSRSRLFSRRKAIDTTEMQPSVKRKHKANYWNECDDDWNDEERNSIEQ